VIFITALCLLADHAQKVHKAQEAEAIRAEEEKAAALEKEKKEKEEKEKEEAAAKEKQEKEEREKKEKEKKKKSSSFNAADSVSENMQDVYPHEGGLYFMPVSNDEKSVTGMLLGTCMLKKDEYEKLEAGDVLDFANDKYMILSISKDGEYGAALSMTQFDEKVDYDQIFEKEDNFEEYFGFEKMIYGLTLDVEEEQIKAMEATDYFKNDGYEGDDMIFFAGTSLYFPLTYPMDEDVTLYFDKDCELTVPDESMIADEEYDWKDYLAGKNSMYPPDLMAAKIETKGNKITKYNVMFVGLEGLE